MRALMLWKVNHKGGALARAVAMRFDGPAMELHEAPDNSQTDAETATGTTARHVFLTEFFEKLRQKFRRNALSCIADCDANLVVDGTHKNFDSPAGRSELERVRQEIVEDLLHAFRIAVERVEIFR